MTYRKAEYLALGALVSFLAAIFLAASIIGHQLGYSPKNVPASTVAPEVCEGNGHVRFVSQEGTLFRVQCSSGLVMLVTR